MLHSNPQYKRAFWAEAWPWRPWRPV